jgi:TetR/AcrR family transcriptional regulator, transcriptional repressor for nem operon
MTATGLGKGSLYGAFGDKRKLFLRVLESYCQERVSLARQALTGPDAEALDRLRSYARGTVDAATRPPQERSCLLTKSTAELAGHDADVAGRLRATFQAIEDAIAASVESAQRHGDIDPAADARQLARVLAAVLRGIEALASAGTDPAALRDTVEGALGALTR